MENKILYVDDQVLEARLLKENLIPLIENPPIIFWMPYISQAKILLGANIYKFDAVLVDINGTAVNFMQNLKELKHDNIIVTSGVFGMGVAPFNFSLKTDLAKKVAALYNKA